MKVTFGFVSAIYRFSVNPEAHYTYKLLVCEYYGVRSMSRCPPSGAAAEVEKSLVAHIYGEWHTSAERDGSCSWTARPELETPSKVRREVSSKAWDDSKYQRSVRSKSSMSRCGLNEGLLTRFPCLAALFGLLKEPMTHSQLHRQPRQCFGIVHMLQVEESMYVP